MAEAATVTDETDLPTPRATLASRYVRVLLTCWHCRHQADADLPALIAAGRGDVPAGAAALALRALPERSGGHGGRISYASSLSFGKVLSETRSNPVLPASNAKDRHPGWDAVIEDIDGTSRIRSHRCCCNRCNGDRFQCACPGCSDKYASAQIQDSPGNRRPLCGDRERLPPALPGHDGDE